MTEREKVQDDALAFAAWLTSRPGVLTVGSGEECGPLAEAVAEWRKANPLRAPASEGEAWNAALEWVAGMLDTENDWAGASAFAMTVRAGRKRLRWDVDVDYMAGGLCTATVSVEAHNADEAAETAVAVVLETRESTSVRNAVARLATHPAPATVTEAMAWQAIETVPKDGTRVLVSFGEAGVWQVAWVSPHWADDGEETWCVDDNKHGPYPLRGWGYKDGSCNPTHWMPTPALGGAR